MVRSKKAKSKKLDTKTSLSNSSELHTYLPLASSEHIRVLRLEPAPNPGAPLRFTFRFGTLTDLLHQYEAISYTWGLLSFPARLYCTEDNTVIPITRNLDSALRRFRDRHDARNLWADAVCINQSDDEEKTVQIPIMRRIYQGASGVLVWLGSGNIEESAIRVLCNISRGTPSTMVSTQKGIQTQVDDALVTIIKRTYFRRSWIIQEVTCNPDVTLFCGNSRISWVRFMAAIKHSQEYLSNAVLESRSLNPIHTLISLWRLQAQGEAPHTNYKSGLDLNMLKLMEIFENADCSNPRDRLYALYNLASNVVKTPASDAIPEHWNTSAGYWCGKGDDLLCPIYLVIDYSLPCESIFQAFAASAMASGYGLDILASAALRKPNSKLTLPSWVTDWTSNMQPRLYSRLHGNLDSFYMADETSVRISFTGYGFPNRYLPKVASTINEANQEHVNEPEDYSSEFSTNMEKDTAYGEYLLWPVSSQSNGVLQAMLKEMDVQGLNWPLLKMILSRGLRLKIPLRGPQQQSRCITLIQRLDIQESTALFPTYNLFFTDTLPFQLSKGENLGFIGIANAPVEKGDYLVIPKAYNPEYNSTRETPLVRTLVLRSMAGNQNLLVGFAYLIPVFASVALSKQYTQMLHRGDSSRNILKEFGFSTQSFTIHLQ